MVKTFWFDMDGVLAIYEREAYIKNYKHGQYTEITPIYLQSDKHYYRYVRPDMKMIEVVKLLQYKSAHNVCVITNITNDDYIGRVQTEDKIYWLNKYCPFINTNTQFFTAASTKNEIASAIINKQLVMKNTDVKNHTGLTLDKSQVLIDDFNTNLINWCDAGGNAVKYINGLNSPESYNGTIIQPYMTGSLEIAKFLSNL